MSEDLVLNLTLILVLSIGAQWLAWRLRVPSILLLLVFGFAAGPLTGWLNPDELLGEWLMPLVSVSVALILFEGGLTLKFNELREVGSVVRNLITVGALVTWLFCTLAAKWALGWPWSLATLFGAILVVTGPTVIMPLLRHVQPERDLRSTLKWEGILIDPIGAFLAVLVFEAIVAQEEAAVAGTAIAGFIKAVAVGGLVGTGGAWLLIIMLRRFLIPDYLQNPVSLMTVIACFTASNLAAHESGLLAATVMGIILANRSDVKTRHIVEFKENLRVLLIGGLFVLLSARLALDDFRDLDPKRCVLFLLLLVVLIRPLAVLVSAAGTKLNWRQGVFLSWMAPRGIVAAAVASLFSLRLAEAGHAQAADLVPMTFLVIVATVAFYGSTASWVAAALKLSQPNPQGLLVVGAGAFAQKLAEALQGSGFRVLLVDSNWDSINQARQLNLQTWLGNVLSPHARHEIDLGGLGRIFAMTPNHEVNTLAVHHFTEFFGRSEIYQLPRQRAASSPRNESSSELEGRVLFSDEATFGQLARKVAAGAIVKKTPLTGKFSWNDFQEHYGDYALPLILITEDLKLRVFTPDRAWEPKSGQAVLSLVDARAAEIAAANAIEEKKAEIERAEAENSGE